MESIAENRILSFLEQHQTTRVFLESNSKAIIKYVLKPACILMAVFTAYIIYGGLNNLGLARTGSLLFAMGVMCGEIIWMDSEFKKIGRRNKC